MKLKLTLTVPNTSSPSVKLTSEIPASLRKRFTIGREQCDWLLPKSATHASKTHATLSCRWGRWFIEDCSSNGTALFGRKLERNKPHPLAPGDVYTLGECTLTVEVAPRAVAQATTMYAEHHALLGLNGAARGKTFPIAKSPFTIGTAEDNDLRLEAGSLASAHHAQLEFSEGQGVSLVDRGSTNGTTVNGGAQRADAGARLLREGDELAFASARFRFQDRAVAHEDPRKRLIGALAAGGVAAVVLAGFALLYTVVWPSAQTLLAQVEREARAARFAPAAEALEAARHARGAEAEIEELEAWSKRLELWERQCARARAYLQVWRQPVSLPCPPAGAAPEVEAERWPDALANERLACAELEAFAVLQRSVHFIAGAQSDLSEEDLRALVAAAQEKLDLSHAGAVGLTGAAQWVERFRAQCAPLAADARQVLTLREVPPERLLQQGIVPQSECFALTSELQRWQRIAAWLRVLRQQTPRAVAAALDGERTPVAMPEAPEAKELQSAAYLTYVAALREREATARQLNRLLAPVAQAWRTAATAAGASPEAATEAAEAQAQAIAQRWLAAPIPSAEQLDFQAAPAMEARRLLPAWHNAGAAAQALADAVEAIEGARTFLAEEAPRARLTRALYEADVWLAARQELLQRLAVQRDAVGQLRLRLLFPEVTE